MLQDDIDETIRRLIENAETMKEVVMEEGYEEELQALQKTQESLLSRLIDRQEKLDNQKSASRRNASSRSRGPGRTSSSSIFE